MKYSMLVWVLLCCGVLTGACSKQVHVVGKPFQPTEERFFDDGMDVIADSSSLSGQFGFETREDLDARSNLADVVALVTVSTVQTNEMASGAERRIEVTIERVLYGEGFSAASYQLRSGSSSLGYTLLERHESALTGQMLLFLRTFPESEGADHHFHLSPASATVLTVVEDYLKKRVEAEQKADDD
ncbi:MAG: hypothetical protein JXX29_11965 [Deltaproteobacteria bacterium]|nr:hypothetical protein [Deltaproteobacteria bacterium]MBN2672390.1 hypothetical protein [Deltaproteobacteria bacterium]